jgi:galactose-1-phosphate uridylyltransferase
LIYQGRTTGIVDVAELSEGFTFINKNLYPVLYPYTQMEVSSRLDQDSKQEIGDRHLAQGLHFLQWTSSFHDRDWHNMPLEDTIKVMHRIAVLERKLVTESISGDEGNGGKRPEGEEPPYVLIVKNFGHLVGGSLAHGHQQIALSNLRPRRFIEDERFERENGKKFSQYLLQHSAPSFMIRDYGPAVLLVPYFMRRPYDMMLLMRNGARQHLYELSEPEIAAVATGWHDATLAIHAVMPRIGRDTAFNIITHNGPGAGLYFEFLPCTQETGGFEHLGLIVCQSDPFQDAKQLRDLITAG